MTCSPGDIAAIPFPYSDLTTRKKRPVLVITKPDRYGDFVGLAVTSVLSVEKSLAINEESLLTGKLPKESRVRYDKIFTLHGLQTYLPLFIFNFGLITSNFPKPEEYGLTTQLRRASISIPDNLAEGAALQGNREFMQFLNIAQGSISELDTQGTLKRSVPPPQTGSTGQPIDRKK
jgi:mRNA interferase MazF